MNSSDKATALAIWTEEIILDPGTVRYPIRVVVVDNLFQTRFDRIVRLPENSTTYIYRVLDHGIPWQHLEAGLQLEEVRKQLLELLEGKQLVLYDTFKTIGLLKFSEDEMNQLRITDLKTDRMLMNVNGGPTSFWDLVLSKLGHRFSGKLGNYDAIELTDFVMSIYVKCVTNQGELVPDQLQLPKSKNS